MYLIIKSYFATFNGQTCLTTVLFKWQTQLKSCLKKKKIAHTPRCAN